jgi:hypothetical protein
MGLAPRLVTPGFPGRTVGSAMSASIPAKPANYRFDPARLRAIRESIPLTREEFAARLHCSVSRVSHAELGYHEPGISKLAEFAAALGVRVDDLLIYDGEAVV